MLEFITFSNEVKLDVPELVPFIDEKVFALRNYFGSLAFFYKMILAYGFSMNRIDSIPYTCPAFRDTFNNCWAQIQTRKTPYSDSAVVDSFVANFRILTGEGFLRQAEGPASAWIPVQNMDLYTSALVGAERAASRILWEYILEVFNWFWDYYNMELFKQCSIS